MSDALTARPALPREAELAPAAAPAARKPFYIPSLDGIRAVSFLIVFVFPNWTACGRSPS